MAANGNTLFAQLTVNAGNFFWAGEDSTNLWTTSISRANPLVATLAGLRTWLLDETPSNNGVDITLAQPGTTPSAALGLQFGEVNSGGPLTADFFTG